MTMTHTYAVLPVSRAAYEEIWKLLKDAGYGEQFHGDLIDMHGIALQIKAGRCRICDATMARCQECGAEWCLDHKTNPLVCPGCGRRK